jgi:redox-sensitive bicupin YhaK (pirin superfamily)
MSQAIPAAAPDRTQHRTVVWTGRGLPASDGAGVKLSRVIGQPALPDLDPFLMLDAFGADDPDAYIAGFPDHPHRGFETVTYMLDGRMRHRDNKGHEGLLTAGSVQWMTAGRGIVHSEMPEQDSGLMRGFQLWINLPAKDKMTAPRYQEFSPERIPTARLADGVAAKVIAGAVADASGVAIKGPVDPGVTEPLFLDLTLAPDARVVVPLPETHNAFAYVYEGEAAIGAESTPLRAGQIAVLSPGLSAGLAGGRAPARAILVAGRPLREPVAKTGPFVMNTQAELRQAVLDYQAGRF